MKRVVRLIGLAVSFGFVISIAALSVLFATGLINYDGNVVWVDFFKNVAYSIFAGIIVVAIIELYKNIENTAKRND
ncbi:MAG: hypothetical protein OXL37_18110 [Chloroflexota bacterium]|nr:hypothetical protein [Chloroflexota bacterium]MDE2958885.1 hypothetical protein [Chloroflexota bacterium]